MLASVVDKFKGWTHPTEARPDQSTDRDAPAGPTPTGVAVFAEDVAIRRDREAGNNIVHWPDFDRGGHFASMEVPDLLVGDVQAFFRGPR